MRKIKTRKRGTGIVQRFHHMRSRIIAMRQRLAQKQPGCRRMRLPSIDHFRLRVRDQAFIAGLVSIWLLAMLGYWIQHGGFRGGLIDIDRAEQRTATFLVDANRAPWPELAQLPGIGETLARRIVESRERDGLFRRHEDLRRVRGLGPKLLKRIAPYLSPMDEPKQDVQE